jgi:hypothetical protein
MKMNSIWNELSALYRRLRNTGPLVELGRECDEATLWADRSLQWVKDRIAEIEKRFSSMWETWFGIAAPANLKPHAVYYQVLAAWFMLVGACFAVAFECLLQGALSVMIFNLPWPWAALIGVAITLAVTYLFKGLVSMFFARHAQHPKQAREVLMWAVAVLLPIQIILLAILFLVTRSFADASESLMWLFWPVSSLLALSTPILAAVLLVGSGLFGWSGPLAGEYDELLTAERKIWALRHHAAAIKPVIVLAVLLFSSSALQAQHVVSVDIDATDSLIAQERTAAVDAVSSALRPIAFRWAEQLRFSAFTKDAWTAAPFYKRNLPVFREPAKSTAEVNKIDTLFKRQVLSKQERASLEYENHFNAELETYDHRLAKALAEARMNLILPPPVRETCTSFWDLLVRYSETTVPTRAISITDGVDTCRRATQPIPAPRGDVHVVVILVSTRGERYPAQGFEDRKREVLKVAAWVTVVPPWGFNACLFSSSNQCSKDVPINERTPMVERASLHR